MEGLSADAAGDAGGAAGIPRMVGAEVLETRLLRDIYSERQLEAVMTDFWLNHFNVYVQEEPE